MKFRVDRDVFAEAVAWAAQIPAAWTGKVEVRPIIDFGAVAS